MLLSDQDILYSISIGELTVDPMGRGCLQPSSVDVRLDQLFRTFRRTKWTHIDPAIEQDGLTELVEVPEGEPFILHPGEFVLGSTVEHVELGARLAARLEGKSSLGRLGLLVHSTAGFVDPGFRGRITLELSNVSQLPVKLWPGMRIGQLCVLRLSSDATRVYGSNGVGSRYQDQVGPVASRSWVGFTSLVHG